MIETSLMTEKLEGLTVLTLNIHSHLTRTSSGIKDVGN